MPLFDKSTHEKFQLRLTKLHLELVDAIASGQWDCQPVSLDQSKVGRVSRIDAIQQQQMLQAGMQAHRNRLALVVDALARLAKGEFGECVDCLEPIARRRLDGSPEIPRCLNCQALRETDGKP